MDLTKIVKKHIGSKFYYTDDTNYYAEYKLKSTDTGLMQIARDQMGTDKQFKEILRLNNGKAEVIVDKNKIEKTWTLLLPTVSPFK